jgi:hypothetical protein
MPERKRDRAPSLARNYHEKVSATGVQIGRPFPLLFGALIVAVHHSPISGNPSLAQTRLHWQASQSALVISIFGISRRIRFLGATETSALPIGAFASLEMMR